MNKIVFNSLSKKFKSASWIEDSINSFLPDILQLSDGDYVIDLDNNKIINESYQLKHLPQPTWSNKILVPFRKIGALLFLKIGCGIHWVCVCIDLFNNKVEILYTDTLPSNNCWKAISVLDRVEEAEQLLNLKP